MKLNPPVIFLDTQTALVPKQSYLQVKRAVLIYMMHAQ